MKLTEERLEYLVFLSKNQGSLYNGSRLAGEFGVSKSTVSRMLNSFFDMGLLEKKGKPMLSSKGQRVAKAYLQEIKKISRWLTSTVEISEEEAEEQAKKLSLYLSPEIKKRIIQQNNKENLFEFLSNVKKINGDVLSFNLTDGEYPVAFTIYSLENMRISMSNRGFKHPAILKIQEGKGDIVLEPKELEHESMMGELILKGRLDTLSYEDKGDYKDCIIVKNKYYIPITGLDFFYSKEERILESSFKIKVKPSVETVHMPIKDAMFRLLLK